MMTLPEYRYTDVYAQILALLSIRAMKVGDSGLLTKNGWTGGEVDLSAPLE